MKSIPMKKHLALISLVLVSVRAFAFTEVSFTQFASCTYTDETSKQVMSATLLVDALADNEVKAKGLIIFKDIQQNESHKGDYAETILVNIKDAKKIEVTLGDDNIVDLSDSNKLSFDQNGKAELAGDNGKYVCDLDAYLKNK